MTIHVGESLTKQVVDHMAASRQIRFFPIFVFVIFKFNLKVFGQF